MVETVRNREQGVIVLDDNDWLRILTEIADETVVAYRKYSEKKPKASRSQSMKVKNVKKTNHADMISEISKAETLNSKRATKREKKSNAASDKKQDESRWGNWFKKRPTRDTLAKKGILRAGYFGNDISDLITQDKVCKQNFFLETLMKF